MQLDRGRLTAILRAGIVRRHVRTAGLVVAPGGRRRAHFRDHVARGVDQALEVWRRRHRHKITSRRQPCDAILAQIVGALASYRLPVAASGNVGLAQHRNLCLRQRIAIFVGHAAFDHGRRLQTNQHFSELLPRAQGQHAPFGPWTVLVDFEKPCTLGKQPVASSRDSLDVKPAVRTRGRGVVSALALILGNEFDERLLHWLAAGILGDDAIQRALRRTRRRSRLGQNCMGDQQSQQQRCGYGLHPVAVWEGHLWPGGSARDAQLKLILSRVAGLPKNQLRRDGIYISGK